MIRTKIQCQTIPGRRDRAKTCCPFHQEETPSCVLFFPEQRFMCFSCGAEGSLRVFEAQMDLLRDDPTA